jgi:SHS2 domain-containing protein
MKKIILILTLLLISETTATEQSYTCIQGDNNFILLYPFLNKWAIITDRPIQAARRAEGAEATKANRVTATTITEAPKGTKKQLWTKGAVDNNLIAYIEPLCYVLQ